MPKTKNQSLEQEAAMVQMAAQAAPMPPPPTPNPMSQLPVPVGTINNAITENLVSKIKGYSTARESEIEKIKQYMQDYSKLNQGTDYRPIAALISGLTGNQQLMQAAEAVAPESKSQVAQNMIGMQAKIAQLMGDQRQAESLLKNQTELARMQYLGLKNQRSDLEQERRKERFLEGQVQSYEKSIQGKASLNNAVLNLESKLGFSLDDYDPATNSIQGQNVDVPGANIPLVGRVSFYDKNARQISDSFSRIFNIELKDRSGAAVTTPELERLKQEFSSGKFQTESELIGAARDYKRLLNEELDRRAAAYSPEVRQIYHERLGDIQGSGSRVPSAPQTKEWNGKKFQLQGDKWVEVK